MAVFNDERAHVPPGERGKKSSIHQSTSRPAAHRCGCPQRRPNFDAPANRAARWDPLIVRYRAARQQFGGPSDEDRPHLEERFSAANAGLYSAADAPCCPLQGMDAEREAERLRLMRIPHIQA